MPTGNLTRLFSVSLCIILGSIVFGFITVAVSSIFSKLISSVAVAMIIAFVPGFVIDNAFANLNLRIDPLTMIAGPYIVHDEYVSLFGNAFDLRLMFPPIAAVAIAVCLILSYKSYITKQTKN